MPLVIGFFMSWSLAQIIVDAMELAPARMVTLAGLFLGLAFGFSGIAAAAPGNTADRYGIACVF